MYSGMTTVSNSGLTTNQLKLYQTEFHLKLFSALALLIS